ncbi:MAG: hypothetical protein ACRC20_14035 [Segniliparus sp.]|uniref:hypothetical protein n=1 Tax=Segniliparus sp. TaxID=2804064 RepID=UPI003F31B6C3
MIICAGLESSRSDILEVDRTSGNYKPLPGLDLSAASLAYYAGEIHAVGGRGGRLVHAKLGRWLGSGGAGPIDFEEIPTRSGFSASHLQPRLAVYQGKLHAVYLDDGQLCLAVCDGEAWSAYSPIPNVRANTRWQHGLAVVEGRLMLVFCSGVSDDGYDLDSGLYILEHNGTSWGNFRRFKSSLKSANVHVAAFGAATVVYHGSPSDYYKARATTPPPTDRQRPLTIINDNVGHFPAVMVAEGSGGQKMQFDYSEFTEPPDPEEEETPWYRSWWFWGVTAVEVSGAVVFTIATGGTGSGSIVGAVARAVGRAALNTAVRAVAAAARQGNRLGTALNIGRRPGSASRGEYELLERLKTE